MPVARREDEVEVVEEAVEGLGDPVALGHGEGAARREVVLKIDDQKRIHAGITARAHARPRTADGRAGSRSRARRETGEPGSQGGRSAT